MNLRLIPAGPVHLSDIIEAMDESGNEIYQAMPWLELDEPIPLKLKNIFKMFSNTVLEDYPIIGPSNSQEDWLA